MFGRLLIQSIRIVKQTSKCNSTFGPDRRDLACRNKYARTTLRLKRYRRFNEAAYLFAKTYSPRSRSIKNNHTHQTCTYNTTTRLESKQYGIRSKHHRSKVFRSLINCLQVDLFPTTPGIHGPELDPDEQATKREKIAEHPEHERRPDRAYSAQNRGGR